MNDIGSRSSFFKRKPKNNSEEVDRQAHDSIQPSETTGMDVIEDSETAVRFEESPKPYRNTEATDTKSFFRFPRRKKASSISRSDDGHRSSTSRANSMETSRASSQVNRSPFDNLFRPSLSARSSTTSVLARDEPHSPGAPPKISISASGSPSRDLHTPVESRSGRNSARSVRSTRSIAISDRTPTTRTSETFDKIKSRGRSLTYGGPEKGALATRPNKFFSINRLRRDQDEVGLFKVISRDRSPLPPPSSPGRTDLESIRSLPPPIDGETPFQFLARLEAKLPRAVIAPLLATFDDVLHHECLQLYMQSFDFVNDPLDMALRKFLMDTHLPKETQQIDRVLNAFAERYQICNPRLFDSQATPYVLSFALIMLHTDRFNQNNKNKMTKTQFIKNTTSEHTSRVAPDVLEYFYDNIICTPFIMVEDELESGLSKSCPTTPLETPPSGRNGSLSAMSQTGSYFGKKGMDLYPLIMENKLDTLRPQLGPILDVEDALSYTGTLPVINVSKLHYAFTHPATLQLVSARSRPEAFVTDDSTMNPQATDPGLVDIQITKIGILRKREQKKPNSKPVYREWGVMLTPSQLLLFKNVAWVKPYMQQLRDSKDKSITLTPPVHDYSPDTYMPTSDTVAVHDAAFSKKPTHFCFYGRGGQQTHLIAGSEDDMNDWIAKINYAAAFHTVGVRIRGIENLTGEHQTHLRRMHRHASTSSTSTIGGSLASAQEIEIARQNVLRQKVCDLAQHIREKEDKLAVLQQHARVLCTLTPIQARTRSQVISAAGSLSAKISWARMELCKTQCHHDILAKDLQLESQPDSNAYTAPHRPRTPGSESSATIRPSPSKSKLSSVFRQVSTDTMKRVNRQFSGHESKRVTSPTPQGHAKSTSEFSIPNIELTPESLSHFFSNSPERPATSEGEEDGKFKLHGRTVSVVRTPDIA